MIFARNRHTASILGTGKVLVTGGFGYSSLYLNSVELYDHSSGVWTTIESMSCAREDHTASILDSGKVLVAGGYDSSSKWNSAELYE